MKKTMRRFGWNPIFQWGGGALAAGLFFLVSSSSAVDVPDPSVMLPLAPAAALAGAPPVIHPGTRLTYFGMTASIPASRGKLVEDDEGGWIDKRTGKRYREEEIYGAAAAAFNVVQVGHIGGGVAELNSRIYLYDPVTKISAFASGTGIVGHAGCAADYWIHPAVLAQVREVKTPDLRILRMPYTVGQKTYRVVRIQREDALGYDARMYDVETGLLVRHVSRVQGPQVITPPDGDAGRMGQGEGSSQIIVGWLADVTDVAIPWGNEAPPPWVGTFRQLSYEGEQISEAVAARFTHQRRVSATLTPTARGRGWLRYRQTVTLESLPGMLPGQEQQQGACGNASIGGLWIPPAGLARLRPGQVIDNNPLIGARVTVGDVGPQGVTLVETGPRHRVECAYDTRTGVLMALTIAAQAGTMPPHDTANITLQFRLNAPPGE